MMTFDFMSINSISVISGRLVDDYERLCAMEALLGERRFASSRARTRDRYISRPALNPLSYGAPRK